MSSMQKYMSPMRIGCSKITRLVHIGLTAPSAQHQLYDFRAASHAIGVVGSFAISISYS